MNVLPNAVAGWSDTLIVSIWRASWQGGIALIIALALTRFWTSLSPRLACCGGACIKMLAALLLFAPLAIPRCPGLDPGAGKVESQSRGKYKGMQVEANRYRCCSIIHVHVTFWERAAAFNVGVCCPVHTANSGSRQRQRTLSLREMPC